MAEVKCPECDSLVQVVFEDGYRRLQDHGGIGRRGGVYRLRCDGSGRLVAT